MYISNNLDVTVLERAFLLTLYYFFGFFNFDSKLLLLFFSNKKHFPLKKKNTHQTEPAVYNAL